MAHYNLAVLLVSEGKRDLGKVHYERALELGVKRNPALDRLFSLRSK